MQEINIRIFEGAFAGNLRAEQRTNLLACLLLLLQIGLLVFLILTEGFAYSFLGIYLLHLLVFPFLVVRIWLDLHPEYNRHLTLTDNGVHYRTGFLKKEQDFDWDEVDIVHFKPSGIEFILKNEEEHQVPLNMITNDAALQKARMEVRKIVQLKGISLTDSQN